MHSTLLLFMTVFKTMKLIKKLELVESWMGKLYEARKRLDGRNIVLVLITETWLKSRLTKNTKSTCNTQSQKPTKNLLSTQLLDQTFAFQEISRNACFLLSLQQTLLHFLHLCLSETKKTENFSILATQLQTKFRKHHKPQK